MATSSRKPRLRVGIIGCGGIANGKHMPSLANLADVEMTAFCDIVEKRSSKAAKDYGTRSASTYQDYRRLLEDTSIDVVHICTPNKSHSTIAVDALEAGKHVMCEKPMAKTAADAKAMLAAAEKTGKKLTIGYQNRHKPDSQYLHAICRRGDLGDIYYARAHAIRRRAVPTWGVFLNEEEQGGGPLIDIGTHALDLTLWMMDNYKPRLLVGSSYRKLADRENAANQWGPWDPKEFTVEDSAFGFILMEDGATIVLESSWALNSLDVGEAITSLSGTEGGADMRSGLRIHGEDLGQLYTNQLEFGRGGVDFYEGKAESAGQAEARAWIQSILDDTEPVVKPKEALVVTEILEAIYKSAETGQPFTF